MSADAARTVRIRDIEVCNQAPCVLFGGMNVLESPDTVHRVADHLAECCGRLGMHWVFKASFDKANRSSADSARGPGLEPGLRMLEDVRRRTGAPLMTDIHLPEQAAAVAEVVDVLQIPAFLCRQTDLLLAAAQTGAALNIKKAQFLAPEDMRYVVDKCVRAGNERLMLCERGSAFGYHNLVVDMLGFDILKDTGFPLLFDLSHSLQRPGAADGGARAGGRRNQALSLGRSALIQGLAGLFVETHPDPEQALCDGPCALPLDRLGPFLEQMQQVDRLAKSLPAMDIE